MNMLKKAALATCLGCVAMVPAIGRQTSGHPTKQDLIITGEPTVAQWSKQTAAKLEKHLDYPRRLGQFRYPEGIVSIHFACSPDGQPTSAIVAKSSGKRDLDRAALRAVERIDTLHPLPLGATRDQRFVANVLFAETEASRDRKLAKLKADADRSNAAWASGNGAPMASMAAVSVGLLPAS